MKRLIAFAFAVAIVSMCGSAQAAKTWDDMSWWGNTGATALPQPDTNCGCGPARSCYWWWPTEAASNVDDGELWGNRGIVFHCWEQPAPKIDTPPPPPDRPTVVRQAIVLNNVLFDFDKAYLKPEGKAEVDKLVAEMKKYPGDTVVIEGHTCDIGDANYNMGLGQRRADAVRAYMVQMGIANDRIQTVSHGETKPAIANDSDANRKLNRRAQFNITIAN